MAWEIAVAGTVTVDDVTTPRGRRTGQLGGSATYFALAAAPRAIVRLCACCGRDREAAVRHALAGGGVDLDGLAVLDAPTYRWRARHDFERWVAVDEQSRPGAYALWRPRLTVAARRAQVLFVGSMAPGLQRAVISQSPAELVAADSMTVHIGEDRASVREVALASDILFLNRGELGALTGMPETAWREAAARLCGPARLRAVVVKAGPLGAALVTATAVVERPARPVASVVDPTGAGDSLAGGLLAACAAAERSDAAFLEVALDAGLERAAACVAAFGVAGLSRPAGARTSSPRGRR